MRCLKYRLSPNEIERLVREDREQRRKLRIVQVREQAKANAAVIRNDVRRAKESLLSNFTAEIREHLEVEKEESIRKLQQSYENTLRTVGEGHREAHLHVEAEKSVQKLLQQREDKAAVQRRYMEALERQRVEEAEKEYEQTKHITARQTALEKEKERAAIIASLPPPPPDISTELDKVKKRAIPMTDMQAFATTHYHIPDYYVIKADSQEQLYDARALAKDSDLKLKQDLAEKKRSQHERIERARIRGNQALQKEMLKHDLGDMLKDLSFLQKRDRRRRQQILSDIPKQVFIPPERCLEERKERQRGMENKFHEMYIEHRKLDSQEIIAANLATEGSMEKSGQDSTTPDISIAMSQINPALRDLTNVPRAQDVPQGDKPETVLKQLLKRIKEQKDNVASDQKSLGNQKLVSEFDSPHVVAEANWQRTEDGDQHERPTQRMSKLESSHCDDPINRQNAGLLEEGRPDSTAITSNNHMIEELQRRIELIEVQKKRLAQQCLAHTSFQAGNRLELPEQDRQLDIETPVASKEDGEVGVAAENDSLLSAPAVMRCNNTHCEPFTTSGLIAAPEILESKLAARIERLASYFKISNGAADVLPDFSHNFKGSMKLAENHKGSSSLGAGRAMFRGRMELTEYDKESSTLDARREINLSTLPSFLGATKSGTFDGGDVRSSNLNQQSLPGFGRTDDDILGPAKGGLGHLISDGQVREYREMAEERNVGMDSETLHKVRDYQQKLVQIHEERKKLLDNVRADLVKQREELYASHPTWLSKGSSSLAVKQCGMNLRTGQSALVTGETKKGEKCKAFIGTYPSLHQSLATEVVVRQTAGKGNPEKIDQVRKSLSFEDGEESFSVSPVSWKDALNVTSTSQCSEALTEDSKLLSSEEERGSPLLAYKKGYTSTLVHKAQERRLGFECRQEELQQQLLNIQQQKDAILCRFYAGQRALQQQQLALSNLTTASSLSSNHPEGQQCAEISAKPADVKSQLSSALGGEEREVDRFSGSKFELRPKEVQLSNGTNTTPAPNMSCDSYLSDISFHKIQSADDKSLPSSAFEVCVRSSAAVFPLPKKTVEPQTWASVLSHQYPSINVQEKLLGQGDGQLSLLPAPQVSFHKSLGAQADHELSTILEVDTPISNAAGRLVSTSHKSLGTLADHEPHELSTILEVDTPTSNAAGRLVSTTTFSNGHNLVASAANSSSHSLSHFSCDLFQDVPYTFAEGKAGTVYHLAATNQSKADNVGEARELKAKRALDFSEQRTGEKWDFLSYEDDLFATAPPALVEVTPVKLAHTNSSASEYMRQVQKDKEETVTSELSTFSVGSNVAGAQEQNICTILQKAKEFDQELINHLRQQSQTIFSPVREGETTGLSGLSQLSISHRTGETEECSLSQSTLTL